MVSKKTRSFGFEIGHPELSAALAKDIIEAIIPKATRKQAQQQFALEAIARSYPTISQMPKEEREKLYSQMVFPAYGVYQPPTIRKWFGAKPETILPLPEGAVEFEAPTKMKSPFGRRRVEAPGVRIPETEPFRFAPPPLIQPEHEAELEKQAKLLYPESPEDQQTWLKTQKTALMTKLKPTKEEMLWEMIEKAERMIGAYKPEYTEDEKEILSTLTPELLEKYRQQKAIAALPPNIRRRYQEHVEKIATDKAYREAMTEDVQARKAERKERMALLTGREKRLAQQQAWYQAFQEQRLTLQDQWKKLAERGKTPQQVYSLAEKAYTTYLRDFRQAERAHNQMEIGFTKLDPNYLPARFSEPKLDWEEWLRTEGKMFYERILSFEQQGGAEKEGGRTIPPPTLPPKKEQPKGAFESIQQKYLQ